MQDGSGSGGFGAVRSEVDNANRKIMRLEAEVERQKRHNKLLTDSLAAERERRKQVQESALKTISRVRRFLRELEQRKTTGLSDLVEELDPGRFIRSGHGG